MTVSMNYQPLLSRVHHLRRMMVAPMTWLRVCLSLVGLDQQYFKELTDHNIRQQMYREQQDQLEQDMAPFGFVVDGLEDENIGNITDEYGTRWAPVVRSYDSNW